MSLSQKQERIIETISSKKEEKFIVRACPGSGKTYTVAHLLAKELESWNRSHHGIAVLSFTNAAKNEIQKRLKDDAGYQGHVGYPHFVGTIDSFLNLNVFSSFANKAMGCQKKPTLVGSPHGSWSPRNFYRKCSVFVSYDINENKYWLNHLKKPRDYNNDKEKAIFNEKDSFTRRGYANQSDANFFCYKTLRENHQVARLIAHRFPYLILDEAQDTSEVQMAAIDLLIENGLKKIVLVGDPDQAIYEWNQARPDLFINKIENNDWISNKLDLNESFRSSSEICTFASKFSSNKFGPAEENESKNFSKEVEVKSWDLEDLQNGSCAEIVELIEEFKEECTSLGIDVNYEKVAVLARGKALLWDTKGQEFSQNRNNVDWELCEKKHIKDACLAKYHYENGNFIEAYRWASDAIFKAYLSDKDEKEADYPSCEKKSIFLTKIGGHNAAFKECMMRCYKLPSIRDFPDICEWLRESGIHESKESMFSGLTFDDIFSQQKKVDSVENDLLYSTIHGIKGGTFDAVLLFLKKSGGNKSSHYKTNLKKEFSLDDENMEEMRNVYVAITRPRKILWIAVPKDDLKIWKEFADA